MRYLLLCAGMGKRLGRAARGRPKCLAEVGGETLITRLARQIRGTDEEADIRVVLGFRSELVTPHIEGCRIVLNPFFDITGINASLWFARESFDSALWILHGDLVLSDPLAEELFSSPSPDLVAYDSSIRDPREINIRVESGRVTRFGVNFSGFSGAYAGVLRLSAVVAPRFTAILQARVARGFNDAKTYYFFVMRRLIAEEGAPFRPFDFAGRQWKEIDYASDLEEAAQLFPDPGPGECGKGKT